MRRRSAALATLVAVSGCGGAPPPPAELPRAAVRLLEDRVEIFGGLATVVVARERYALELRAGRAGPAVAREHPDGGVFYERGGERFELGRVLSARRLVDGAALEVATGDGAPAAVTLRWRSPHALAVTVEPPEPETLTALGDRWHTPPDERIYGLTERLRDSRVVFPGVLEVPVEEFAPPEAGSLSRRGETIEMVVKPTIALYAPFYQTSRGYGLAVSGTAAGVYDVADAEPETLHFRFETGRADESRRLRFHLFYGPEPAAILDAYTALTGRPFVPPRWAFRHWRYRDELPVDGGALLDGSVVNGKVAEDLRMYDELGIPAGVYLFDRPWAVDETDGFYFSRFEWDEERLPNPAAMLAALRRRGFRAVVWVSTFACGSGPEDHGTEAWRRGWLAPGSEGPPRCGDFGGGGFVLDVTHPSARVFLRDRFRDFAARWEIDGVKLDRGEEFIPSRASDVWADGRSGREVRNAYPTLQARLFHDALRGVRGEDFAVLARAGYAGTQRYAIFWGGDIPGSVGTERGPGTGPGTDLGLRSAIIAQLRAAFLGFPIWGSDVGGYYEHKDREVFARWIEFGAFSGIMNIGGKGNRAPWDMPTEPRYDEELIRIYRRYVRLREELLDYLVAAARRAGESGLPIARPLVFLDRDDPRLLDLWDQYLFGPDLMVAPVWRSGARRREVYFPAGRWRSFWDEAERYEGPTSVSVDVPLDTIPVYIRGDAPRPGR